MFTGLIEAVGHLADVTSTASGARISIRTSIADEMKAGDSLAVNGVCLTVIPTGHGELHADVGPETARITTLGSLKRDQAVNLERPMRADGRFGGHLVQGHVDGTGTIEDIRAEGDAHWVTVAFDAALSALLIRKWSLAVDWVSLTVAELGATRFEVMLVPFTWDHTTLRTLRPGNRVNLECDMVGKYVVRAIETLEYRQRP